MFHVFPNKEHAITRSGLLQDIYEWSAWVLKIREFLLADLLKCSINDGDFLKNGRHDVVQGWCWSTYNQLNPESWYGCE
jgi:hypothetical protein